MVPLDKSMLNVFVKSCIHLNGGIPEKGTSQEQAAMEQQAYRKG